MNNRSILALSILALSSVSPALAQEAPKPAPAAQPAPKTTPASEPQGKPVDQSQAAAVLKDSPRHGEWVDVPMVGGAAGTTSAPIKT